MSFLFRKDRDVRTLLGVGRDLFSLASYSTITNSDWLIYNNLLVIPPCVICLPINFSAQTRPLALQSAQYFNRSSSFSPRGGSAFN